MNKNIEKSLFDNDLQSLKNAIARGEDPNILNVNGNSSLMVAVLSKYTAGLKELLKVPGIDIDLKNISFGYTPLMQAIRNSNMEFVKLLIESGANVNAVNNEKSSPFMESCYSGNLDIIKCLIDNKANLNLKDKAGYNGFLMTIIKNDYKSFKTVLKEDADIYTKTESGTTAVDHICYFKNKKMAKDFCEQALFDDKLELIKDYLDTSKSTFKGEELDCYYYFKSLIDSFELNGDLSRKLLKKRVETINKVIKL